MVRMRVPEERSVMGNESGMRTHAPSKRLNPAVSFGALALLAVAPAVAEADGLPAGVALSPAQLGGGGAAAVQDVRRLPVAPEWKPGDPITVRPPMRGRGKQLESPPPEPQPSEPPPSGPQSRAQVNFTKKLVKDGQGFTGVSPPDTTGAVGASHFIQLINGPTGSRLLSLP